MIEVMESKNIEIIENIENIERIGNIENIEKYWKHRKNSIALNFDKWKENKQISSKQSRYYSKNIQNRVNTTNRSLRKVNEIATQRGKKIYNYCCKYSANQSNSVRRKSLCSHRNHHKRMSCLCNDGPQRKWTQYPSMVLFMDI